MKKVRTQTKRALSVLLAVVMVVLAVPVATAYTYSGSCGNNVTYTLDDSTGVLELKGYGKTSSYPWSSYKTKIKTVKIQSGITYLKDWSFNECTNLETVSLPSSIQGFGEYVFYNCSKLKYISIPKGVTLIPEKAFYGCKSLSSIYIPDTVESIGVDSFNGCSGATTITIPNSVLYIGSGAFSGCSSITNITIPGSVTRLYGAFGGCSDLQTVIVENGLKELYDFSNCIDLKSVSLPNSLTTLGGFSGCTSLSTITVPEGVTRIEEGAFSGCRSLKSVYLPKSLTRFDTTYYSYNYYYFFECTLLKDIFFAGSEADWKRAVSSSGYLPSSATVHYNSTGGGTQPGNGQKFPSKYNFASDRLQFENIDESIDYDYYVAVLGAARAAEVYGEDGRPHGHCYGMAAGTASILNNMPKLSDWRVSLATAPTKLYDMSKSSWVQVAAKNVSLREFIKYYHVYQFTTKIQDARVNPSMNGIKNVYNAVKNAVETKGYSDVIIDFQDNGHTVYGIGIEGNNILVNDSNEPNEIKTIYVDGDNWRYSGGGWTWSSNLGHTINYITDVTRPYVSVQSYLTYKDPLIVRDRVLVYLDSNTAAANKNVLQPVVSTTGTGTIGNKLYYMKSGTSLKASNSGSNTGVFKMAGDSSLVTARLAPGTSAEISLNESAQNQTVVQSASGKAVNLSFATFDNNGNKYEVSVQGVAAKDQVSATQKLTNVSVDGLSNANVVYSKDGKTVSQQQVTVDDNHYVDISVDDSGRNIDVEQKEGNLTLSGETDPNACPYCGEVHEGFFGKIVAFFHNIFFRIKSLFVKK